MSIEFTFNGLTVTDENAYTLAEFDGWTEWPSGTRLSLEAPGRHGELVAPVRLPARIVTAAGQIGPEQRTVRMQAMANAYDPPADPMTADVKQLTATVDGITRTADAQLLRFRMPLDPRLWVGGVVDWAAQWVCSDPMLYAPWQAVTVPITDQIVGVPIPAMVTFTLPDSPFGGSVTVENPGRWLSPAEYLLTGPVTDGPGVINETTGKWLAIADDLAAGDTLRIITGANGRGGYVEHNGIRRPTVAGSSAVATLGMVRGANHIRALGIPGGGAPLLTARVRPAYPTGVSQ